MDKLTLYVKDFSRTPGTRHRDEGRKSNSGQQFREEYLEPYFSKVISGEYNKLVVNLDGTIGFGTSWLEEVFGGLTRHYDTKTVMSKIEFVSKEEPYLIEDIHSYIEHAKDKVK
ncbi:STAS-like domain-containing protein [Sphingobacterium corticibacter]|uniref:DUF4325 domain-containing protein n=1 Tax=Sphingobacterium corticibacter TaxID=2171749 RepID=A0A2T8HNI1_9SPHI|nr:STAS-like domain-containing protein [Sphingobacterium corticibacter]PVH26998.1 DUF4325 domain-containing protein [Sphingobacterium corticibacter]